MRKKAESYFNQKKALCAWPGTMVVTDGSSHFEWVGSLEAENSIIIFIHGLDKKRKKVAICGHLPTEYSPYSINQMLVTAQIKDILSVHLFSGCIQEEEPITQQLLRILRDQGVKNPYLSLGNKVTKAAINVKTGKISYEVFTPQNAGQETFLEPLLYLMSDMMFTIIQANLASLSLDLTFPNRQLNLRLSADGRGAEQVLKIRGLQPPVSVALNKLLISIIFAEFRIASLRIQFDESFYVRWRLIIGLIKSVLPENKTKMITDRALEEKKLNLKNPHSFRFSSNQSAVTKEEYGNSAELLMIIIFFTYLKIKSDESSYVKSRLITALMASVLPENKTKMITDSAWKAEKLTGNPSAVTEELIDNSDSAKYQF